MSQSIKEYKSIEEAHRGVLSDIYYNAEYIHEYTTKNDHSQEFVNPLVLNRKWSNDERNYQEMILYSFVLCPLSHEFNATELQNPLNNWVEVRRQLIEWKKCSLDCNSGNVWLGWRCECIHLLIRQTGKSCKLHALVNMRATEALETLPFNMQYVVDFMHFIKSKLMNDFSQLEVGNCHFTVASVYFYLKDIEKVRQKVIV